jgi:uncharacterized protein (UPF0332 family)
VNRPLVLAEWQRARSALRAAQILTREGCYPDAVSRSYYSVFHAAKAALAVRDILAETHKAVRRMFGLHLIKTGAIQPEWAAHLGGTLDDRLAADYNAEAPVSEQDARLAYRQARQFERRIRDYLLSEGFTRTELERRRKKDG